MKTLFSILICFFMWQCSDAQQNHNYNIFDHYIASGYMGDIKNILLRKNYRDNSRPDSLCTKISYSPGQAGWAGVYWQYPANNWCKTKGKDFSKSGFSKMTFWVKGERGGEEVKFKVGQDCGDSFVSDEITEHLKLSWEKITISLTNSDLSNITGAFCWIVDSKANNGIVIFYLDDVQFE